MKKLLTVSVLLGGALAFAETVDELAPYAKGVQNDYWDTTTYQETVVSRATSAAFDPMGTTPASAVSTAFYDFSTFCLGLSNALDICADPAGLIITIR